MLSSRGYLLGRSLQRLLTQQSIKSTNNLQNVRHGGHAVQYRVAPHNHSKATLIGAQIVGGAMWWWVLWHLWHEYEHITGEWEYPDAKSWTNTELGIPPDDEEI